MGMDYANIYTKIFVKNQKNKFLFPKTSHFFSILHKNKQQNFKINSKIDPVF